MQVENEFIRIRCATELQEAGIKFEKIPKTTTDELPELPILFEEVIIQTAPPNTEQVKNEEFIRIRCATELQEAGIKFEKIPKTTMDELPELPILFEEAKGIMKISELTIDNGTESLLRNLTDYEQYQNTRYGPLVSYIDVMDGLINTVKDVKILCESGILTNCLGDEEVVAQMFNRLGVCVRLPPENNYKEMLKNVNKYCDRKWNKWMANLWHNYFNTPWAIISFFAALVLLILAAVQTVFSVLAYFKSSCLGEGLVLLISSVFMNVGQYCRVLH